MTFDVFSYVALILVAVASLILSLSWMIWALVGRRSEAWGRRFRASLTWSLLFVAALAAAISTHYFTLRPSTWAVIRPDFQPPYQQWSSFLSFLTPALALMSGGLAIWAILKMRGGKNRIVQWLLLCLLSFVAASIASYWIVYHVQSPAFVRHVMIAGREWQTHVGEAAPNFSVTTIDGAEVNLAEFRGRLVLVNFFATWCGPCVLELPHLQQLWDELGSDEGFAMLVIGREESRETVAEFQTKHGFTFPFAVDPDRSAFSEFADDGIPRTYLIARDGRILYQSIGFAESEVYTRELAALRQLIDRELSEDSQ
jgi:peroxiredoxin